MEGLEGRELLTLSALEFPAVVSGPTSAMNTAPGPGGNIWFTSRNTNLVGSIMTAGTVVQSIALPAGSLPRGITLGPDGNLWFAEHGTSKIGRVTPAGALLPEIALPAGSGPLGIAVGPDGNIWFTEADSNRIGHVTTAGVLLPEFVLPVGSFPYEITAGPDGNLWFTEQGTNRIGHVTPAGALFPEVVLPGGSMPAGITVGSDGQLWFTEGGTNEIGHVPTAGAPLSEVALMPGSASYDITAAPDGNLYVAEQGTGKIGMVTTSGVVTEVALPAGAHPWGITTGLDGNVYFADIATRQIGRAVTGGFVTGTIAPADVHGTDGANLLTNVTTPTFAGKSKGGAWVVVVAMGQQHITFPAVVAGALADPGTGNWSITLPVPLADDTYTFAAWALDPLGGGSSPIIPLTAAAKPLEISTAPPVVIGAGYDRSNGLIAFTLHGTKALDPATLNNTANYVLSGYKSKKGPITIIGVTLTTSGTDTRVVLQLGNLPKKSARPKKIMLRVISGGVRDGAGNALDGDFNGSVPTGNGQGGGDFVAWVPLQLKKKK